MPEESRLPDAIATDDAIAPTVCECEGCPRTAMKCYLAIRWVGKDKTNRIRFEPKETSIEGR